MKRNIIAVVPIVLISALVAAVGSPGPAPATAASAPELSPASTPPVLRAGTPTADADAAPGRLPVMGDYQPAKFAQQAARLDPRLAAAAQQELGMSAAQYLAAGAAASDAGAVLEALKARDSGVLDGRMSGTSLTVYVSTPSAAALASSTGARVVVGPAPAVKLPEIHATAVAETVRGGQPYAAMASTAASSAEICSVGFTGYALPGGAPQLLTAGHCADPAQPLIRILSYTKPDDRPISANMLGATLGTWVPGTAQFGGGSDSSLMALNTAGAVGSPSVLTWGGGTGAPLASAPVDVTNTASAVVGAPICKSGATTGWSCGTVLGVDIPQRVADDNGAVHLVNSIVTSACAIPGDSGGAALIGTAAAGVTSWTGGANCSSPSYASGFAPMVSSNESVIGRLGSVWEPAVAVGAVPTVTSLPSTQHVALDGTISGRVSGAVSGDYIKVQFSGEATARTASIVNGTWALSLAGLAPGVHSYTIRAAWGTYSLGPASSGALTVVATPMVTRYAGTDRYATSVAISKAAYPDGAKVVYVATGTNYPDALSAGPIAAKERGPLLLTAGTLPSNVSAEIARLRPDEIVIVGGTGAVSASVATALGKLAPKVTRIGGADRFDTSRRLVARAFPGAAPTVYLATGFNFPDALAAGAAAGAHTAPVLLVDGTHALSGATSSFLAARQPSSTILVGGPGAISSTFETSLGQAGYHVTRLAGQDRFATAEVIGRVSFPTFQTAYFATGYAFPDALAGSAVAGAKGAPLFTVPGTCVPAAVIADLVDQASVQGLVLLGGTAAVSDAVGRLAAC